ncbi:MAG: helicase associated domain-containing protein, partial [Prosthecobacter sp.]|uniref:helicase associated domain-containing protein n=1 Tax=Prosthecobacter sp. TaxID=1965333 RepID=UPI0038FF76A4
HTTGWEGRYAELVAFKAKHGHLRVTLKNQTSPGFMHWRDNQRINFHEGRLSSERKARLDVLGFEWQAPGRTNAPIADQNEDLWEKRFGQLVAFEHEHGHTQVPSKWQVNPALGKWASLQRKLHKSGQLRQNRAERLKQIGFAWKSDNNHHTAGWEGRFAELVAFKERFGHLRVSMTNQTSPGFKHWRDNQRLNFREGRLRPERQARLEALGFQLEAPGRLAMHKAEQNTVLWGRMFEQLLAYREQHGHCQVPAKWRVNPALGKWVLRQRWHNNRSSLPRDRKERLEQIGFAWKSDKLQYAQGWEERLAELVAFKERHGHLRVTMTNQTSAGLCHWRDNQRINFRNGTLTPERKARLDALGFDWQPPDQPRPLRQTPLSRPLPQNRLPKDSISNWEHFFARLVAFHAQHGHAHVPSSWPEDRALSGWVREQRRGHVYGRLHFDQITRLEKLGFAWQAAH